MDETLAPITPRPAQTPQPRELVRMALMAIIGVGVFVMFLRDVLADIPYARTGVAILTAVALVGFYLTEKKKE